MTDKITQLDVTVAEHGRDLLSLGRRTDVVESENREYDTRCDERVEKFNDRMGNVEKDNAQLKVQVKILMGTFALTAFSLVVQTLVNWLKSGGQP